MTLHTVMICNELIEEWEIGDANLMQLALENSQRLLPSEFSSMRELLKDVVESEDMIFRTYRRAVMDMSFTAGSNAAAQECFCMMEGVQYVRSPFLVGRRLIGRKTNYGLCQSKQYRPELVV